MVVEGHGCFFCRYRELLVDKSVLRFLFEGDELGDFCKGFDVNVLVLLMTMGIILISDLVCHDVGGLI